MKFEDFLKEKKDDLESIEVFEGTWSKIENEISAEPVVKSSKTKKYALIIGISSILLLLAIWNYTNKVEKIEENHEHIASEVEEIKMLLAANRDGERIRAINKVGFMPSPDPDKQNILIHTFLNDQSVNVKIAALNALEPYMNEENVRIALIEELDKSDDNRLLLRIISSLSSVNEKRVKPYLEGIIVDEKQHKVVKDEAGIMLEKIKNI